MKGLSFAATVAIAAVAIGVVFSANSALGAIINPKDPNWPAPNWPEIFEPNQPLMNLNIEMLDPNDWDVIRLNGLLWDDVNQEYYEPPDPNIYLYELPAWFWADGEEDMKIKVAVRQKSCIPLGDVNDRYFKISFKVDVNQFYTEDVNGDPNGDPNAVAHWHGLSKLSLENGDDTDVVTEGLASNLHTMSSGPEGYGYDAWRANWVTIRAQDVNRGVYVSAEQRNKQFLTNRNWCADSNNTWMYKITGENETLLKVPDQDAGEVPPEYPDSPARLALDYTPFMPPNSPPDDANLVADMNEWVNMQGLLAMAAINAYVANSDSLFSHYQNTYFVDYNLLDPCETRKRIYLPWDLDSPMNALDWDIYERDGGATTWQQVFLASPTYRPQYNQIMRDLLESSLSYSNIESFLDMMEPILHDALAADPFNQFDAVEPPLDAVTEHFTKVKDWYADRIDNVEMQLDVDDPHAPPGTILLFDSFEGAVWDANWSGDWTSDTAEYLHGLTAAKAETENPGPNFTTISLDASDATAINIKFYYNKDDTEYIGEKDDTGDFLLYYYDGSSYNFIVDMDEYGGAGNDRVWLKYTDRITDSNYFVADFKLHFNAELDTNKEHVWIDLVEVTKETPHLISGYILDPCAVAVDGVSVDANNGGGSDTTDANGYYEVEVPFDWTGTVTPTKTGYTFEPNSITYSTKVREDKIDQDYTATLLTYTISGTITVDSSGLEGVTMSGLPGDPCTDANGVYSGTVDYGWSGTVTPTIEGYSFEPNSTPYSNVTSDQSNQDYSATLNTYTISGTVTCGGPGLDGVVMSGLPGDPCTDVNGFYTATVDYDWGGTVTPTKAGYTFNPASRLYSNVASDQLNQDYTATLLTYTISGTVTCGGPGLEGVEMSGLPGDPCTDANGIYSATVDYGWSGTVTPTKAGYTFIPASRPYSNVTSDQLNQDYSATLNTYTISGTITAYGSGLDGVTMSGLPGDPCTDVNGFYTATADYGWSNTVTPTKVDYNFTPPERVYSNVTSDQLTQDYTAVSVYDLDPDGAIDFADLEVLAAAWLSGTGEGNWNEDCDFYVSGTIDFKDFAKFAAAWQLE